jgi:hypothetical protein
VAEIQLKALLPTQPFQIYEGAEVLVPPDFIHYTIPKSWIDTAQELADKMGALKNSIESGKANVFGFLGEMVYCHFFGGAVGGTYDYDHINPFFTVDSKTKSCTSVPHQNYSCSVAAYNTSQDCDFYSFVRIEKETKERKSAYLLGYYPKELYYQNAVKFLKGQIDPENRFEVKADCYNMKYGDLYKYKVVRYNNREFIAF